MIGQHVTTVLPGTRSRSAGLRQGAAQFGWFLWPFGVLVVAWYLAAESGIMPKVWLPSPLTVLDAFGDVIASGEYFTNILASLSRFALGFVLAAAMGIGLGIALGLGSAIAELVRPVISFANAISGIAWIPLAILWFGLGTPTVLFIMWNAIFFLVVSNTLVGIRSVPRVYESALLTMGASKWRVIRDVLLPGALPNIVTGLRMGMGFGWRALIAAEIFASSSGLGYMIFNASYYFQTDKIIVGLITIGTIWLLTDRLLLVPFENWTIRRWGMITKAS